jgi:hypothetical protein
MTRLASRIAVVLGLSVMSLACVLWPEGSGPDAQPMPLAEALARRDRGEAVLIDVRGPESYVEGHIPGALNIAASELVDRVPELRRMGRLPILYCG